MSVQQRGGDPIELDGQALGRLNFDWVDDRYQHRWIFGGDQVVLESIESNSRAVWPSSPPLQQIHQQSFADGREVVFGVGMSGRGHWSASYTLVPDLKCWIVELACRSPVEPGMLASSYTLLGDWNAESDEAYTTQLAEVKVSLEPLSPATASKTDAQISIRPATIASGDTTSQWAFRLRAE